VLASLHRYEALRAGPKWNSTLFLVAYDDIGGYFDHVIPPSEGVPAPDAPCNSLNDGFPSKFDFRRLGGRATALLMGGRVPRKVIQEPERCGGRCVLFGGL
jgi:phospholipase C